jgi:hypothetical protein
MRHVDGRSRADLENCGVSTARMAVLAVRSWDSLAHEIFKTHSTNNNDGIFCVLTAESISESDAIFPFSFHT